MPMQMPPPSLGGDNYPSDVTYGPTSYSENSSPREEVHCAPREIISDDRGTTIYLEAMVGQGAHGVVFRDIKPSNILCMYDNTYVLVDFGTFARISDSRISMTVGDCNWSEYAPPFDEELGESTESWSIGCVGVVLLVWIVCGPSGVEKFRKRRKSCQQKKSTGIVRECVPFFHACGSGGLSLNPAVDEALKLLESHYQEVVNIFQGMLSMNRATRLTATQAADQLNIYLRGIKDSKAHSPVSTMCLLPVQHVGRPASRTNATVRYPPQALAAYRREPLGAIYCFILILFIVSLYCLI